MLCSDQASDWRSGLHARSCTALPPTESAKVERVSERASGLQMALQDSLGGRRVCKLGKWPRKGGREEWCKPEQRMTMARVITHPAPKASDGTRFAITSHISCVLSAEWRRIRLMGERERGRNNERASKRTTDRRTTRQS